MVVTLNAKPDGETKMQIIYRDNDYSVVARMEAGVPENADAAGVIAQKYMQQFPSIASAHIVDDASERVISRTTEWQKRN